MKIVPIILLGGSGTRLWPVSRKNNPKQFLNLIGEETMLQATLSRLHGIENLLTPIVICNEAHRFIVAEQLLEIGNEMGDIILEPVGKDTAPAITIGALRAQQKHGDILLLVLPADHVIKDIAKFQTAVKRAADISVGGKLVSFGIVPNKPETGYGYLKRGNILDDSVSRNVVYEVEEFVEKPNLEIAESYISSGDYYWNSGMFLFKASTLLKELEIFQPEVIDGCKKALEKCEYDLDFIRLDNEVFAKCPKISIDYALMEKSKNVAMVLLDVKWSDIGSWNALWEIEDKGNDNNVINGDVLVHDSSNCLVRSESKLVSLVGVDNLVVVETKDAVLVVAKDQCQKIKSVVDQLSEEDRKEVELHQERFRPWGKFDCIDRGERFQVKRITIKPGEGTSLQVHKHRAEHWVIVSGIAEITCNDEVSLCSENQSMYIPQGSTHSISNPGKTPMEMIEVQTGSYLGEDDIVRIKDRYKRTGNK